MTNLFFRTASLIAFAATGACEAVPVLVYPDADAVVDAAVDAGLGVDGAADATGAIVSVPEAGCPGPLPPAGATTCCGAVPCNGACATRCADCETTCSGRGTFCCAKMNNVLCRPAGAACP